MYPFGAKEDSPPLVVRKPKLRFLPSPAVHLGLLGLFTPGVSLSSECVELFPIWAELLRVGKGGRVVLLPARC